MGRGMTGPLPRLNTITVRTWSITVLPCRLKPVVRALSQPRLAKTFCEMSVTLWPVMSVRVKAEPTSGWIPACAGMTGSVIN